MTAFTTLLAECNLQNIESIYSTNKTSTTNIQTLGPYDILCGRCKTAFNNVGNRRFRVTISMNLQAYLATKNRPEKSSLIASIANFLQEGVGARFLKPQKGGGYIELGDKEARQKIGHALRDMAVVKQQSTMTEYAAQQQHQQTQEHKHTVEKGEAPQQKTLEDDGDEISLESCLESLLSELSSDDDSDDGEPFPLYFGL